MNEPRRGFTLLEVMLVVIVIGVLGTITVPRILQNVERFRGAEAREVLYKAYAGYQRYIQDNTTRLPAVDNSKWRLLGMDNPNLLANRFFNYAFIPAAVQGPTTCRATLRTNAARRIEINLASGAVTNTSPF